MAVTSWRGVSGDWNDPAAWTNGVPGAMDTAEFPQPTGARYVVTGDGPAGTLTFDKSLFPVIRGTLTGTHNVSAFVDPGAYVTLDSGASLIFQTATIGATTSFASTEAARISASLYPADLILTQGASISGDALTLARATVEGSVGVLASSITLIGPSQINAAGVFTGVIGGSGALTTSGTVELTNNVNSFSGGLAVGGGRLELANAGAAGVGGLQALGGALVIDGSTAPGPITAGGYGVTVSAAQAGLVVFTVSGSVDVLNGSGASTVVGEVGFGPEVGGEGPAVFGGLSVSGGTGRVTVFAGDCHGAIYGGTAGGNVLVGGASTSGLTLGPNGFAHASNGQILYTPGPVTIGGGGDGDLLVATGGLNNLIAAASGNETLTGTTATGNNTYYAGPGSDVIAAGLGNDTVVAGGGSGTISAGAAGTTDIFLGTGQATVLGGGGVCFTQAGQGSATLYNGTGYDLLGVVAGQAGGSITVAGFKVGIDQIQARGYAVPPQVATTAAGAVLTFTDNTNVTLLGVGSLPANSLLLG